MSQSVRYRAKLAIVGLVVIGAGANGTAGLVLAVVANAYFWGRAALELWQRRKAGRVLLDLGHSEFARLTAVAGALCAGDGVRELALLH